MSITAHRPGKRFDKRLQLTRQLFLRTALMTEIALRQPPHPIERCRTHKKEYHIFGRIIIRQETTGDVRCDSSQRIHVSQNIPAQRTPLEMRCLELVVNQLRSRIPIRVYLVDDDLTLLAQLSLRELRICDKVAE